MAETKFKIINADCSCREIELNRHCRIEWTDQMDHVNNDDSRKNYERRSYSWEMWNGCFYGNWNKLTFSDSTHFAPVAESRSQ